MYIHEFSPRTELLHGVMERKKEAFSAIEEADTKGFSNLVLHYVAATGEVNLLESPEVDDIVSERLAGEIMGLLRNYEEYDKEHLFLEVENKYRLTRKEARRCLRQLERKGLIDMTGDSVVNKTV